METRLITAGQVIKKLGKKISVIDKQIDVVKKSGIPIVSVIPSGKGSAVFISSVHEGQLEDFLLRKYKAKFHHTSQIEQLPMQKVLDCRFTHLNIQRLGVVSDDVKHLRNQVLALDAKIDRYEDVLQNLAKGLLVINDVVNEIRDVWKTEEKNEQH